MHRRITCAAVVSLAAAAAVAEPPDLDLDHLIEEALTSNLSLQVLQHGAAAARAGVPAAGALPDPGLKLELSNVPFRPLDIDGSPMSGRQVTLSQKLPYPGKRGARERAASHAAAAAEAARQEREGTVVNLVKQAYFDLDLLDRSIAITEKNRALLQDFVRIAQTKYSVGRVPQQDVLKAQVSLSGLRRRLLHMEGERRRTAARLNTLLDRDPREPVGPTPAREQTPLDFEAVRLLALALDGRPLLKGLHEGRERWRAVEELAVLDRRPDFQVSAGWRQRGFEEDPVSGSDFFSVGVMLTLPVHQGRKQDSKVAEARARVREAEARIEAEIRELALRIEELHVDAQTHLEEMALFRDVIIPQAGQSLAAAIAGYQVDEVDFLTLLDNQMTLLDFEIDYHRHLTQYEKSLAHLESVVGRRLF